MRGFLGLCGALALTTTIMASASVANAAPTISIGDTLDVMFQYPEFGSDYHDSGDFTYTGSGQSIQYGLTTVFLNDNQIVFSDAGCTDGCQQIPADWNGPVVFDLSNSSAFDGWTVESDTVGITSFILGGGKAGVNWQGAFPNGGEVVVGISAAPEPAIWALMIAGIGAVGASLRLGRRREYRLAAAA